MKFLVDNQLPRALTTLLENLGHHAVHVLDVELSQVDDLAIWAYAAQYGYTIISKDADFADLALLARTEVRVGDRCINFVIHFRGKKTSIGRPDLTQIVI